MTYEVNTCTEAVLGSEEEQADGLSSFEPSDAVVTPGSKENMTKVELQCEVSVVNSIFPTGGMGPPLLCLVSLCTPLAGWLTHQEW